MKQVTIFIIVLILSGCTEKENLPTHLKENISTSQLREFQFQNIEPRLIYGGLGKNSGSIGEITSFYINSGTSIPDFEILKKGITDNFLNKKAYIERTGDSEIKICTLKTGGSCFIENGTLVESFIKKYGL